MKIEWEDGEGKPLSRNEVDELAKHAIEGTLSSRSWETSFSLCGDTLILAHRSGRYVDIYDCKIRRTGTTKFKK